MPAVNDPLCFLTELRVRAPNTPLACIATNTHYNHEKVRRTKMTEMFYVQDRRMFDLEAFLCHEKVTVVIPRLTQQSAIATYDKDSKA